MQSGSAIYIALVNSGIIAPDIGSASRSYLNPLLYQRLFYRERGRQLMSAFSYFMGFRLLKALCQALSVLETASFGYET